MFVDYIVVYLSRVSRPVNDVVFRLYISYDIPYLTIEHFLS